MRISARWGSGRRVLSFLGGFYIGSILTAIAMGASSALGQRLTTRHRRRAALTGFVRSLQRQPVARCGEAPAADVIQRQGLEQALWLGVLWLSPKQSHTT
jgi:hypothetical protein